MAVVLKSNVDGQNWAFVHIPKTGGVWCRKVFEIHNLLQEPVHELDVNGPSDWPLFPSSPAGVISQHATARACGWDPSLAFAFVRHPLTWYRSNWRYTLGAHGSELLRTVSGPRLNGIDCLMGADSMIAWIEACLAFYPEGMVSRLFQTYTSGLGFVGKLESLESDLHAAMELASVPDVPERFDVEPQNTSEALTCSAEDPCYLPIDFAERILKAEWWATSRFGYPATIDECLQYPELQKCMGYKTSVVCPICWNTVERFSDFGEYSRPDAICETCGGVERHRLLILYLRKKRPSMGRTLDIGPEPSVEKTLRNRLGTDYLTGDLSRSCDTVLDATFIRFPDAQFDTILCSHVLEHVENDRAAMREIYRVLAPGGELVLQVPTTGQKETSEGSAIIDPEERKFRLGTQGHVRNYGYDIIVRLKDAGFCSFRVQPEHFLRSEEIARYGITEAAGDLYVCRRHHND